MGTYIALGLALGAATGLTVLDNLPLGLGVGVMTGIVVDLTMARRNKR